MILLSVVASHDQYPLQAGKSYVCQVDRSTCMTYVYIYIYTHVYISIYIYIYTYIYIERERYRYIEREIERQRDAYVDIYIYIYTHTVYIYKHIHTSSIIHVSFDAFSRWVGKAVTYTHIRMSMHVYIYIYIYMYMSDSILYHTTARRGSPAATRPRRPGGGRTASPWTCVTERVKAIKWNAYLNKLSSKMTKHVLEDSVSMNLGRRRAPNLPTKTIPAKIA